MSKTTIADFYAGKCVFLTGGTGFLGKVLLEKLLYSCPDVDKVFILIREKSGISIDQRINNLFDDPLFQRLKLKRPQFREKLIPILGDIHSERLGLSLKDEKTLIKKVAIVIHAAATVKFNEPLMDAWRSNVEGTRMILDLAQRMKIVEVFVHVSTAYTNADRKIVDEVLYPPPADIDEVHRLLKDNLTDDETRKIIDGHPNTYTFTKALSEHLVAENAAYMPTVIVRPSIDGHPNTYTFTKALSEHLVAENAAYMPTVIVRPSIVTAINNDPIKGWLDNWNGATGILWSTVKGLNFTFYGKESNILDVIPVDYVTNAVLAAAAKHYRSGELKIYHCCTSECNPLTAGDLMKNFRVEATNHKIKSILLPNWYIFTRNSWLMYFITMIFQITPAYVADIYRLLIRKRPMYVKLQSRIIRNRDAITYFVDNTWTMKADHTRELFSSLSTSDKRMFPCDPTTIDWNKYIRDYVRGVAQFLDKRAK